MLQRRDNDFHSELNVFERINKFLVVVYLVTEDCCVKLYEEFFIMKQVSMSPHFVCTFESLDLYEHGLAE